ncbi:MAG: methyltransferase family protein [Planctomycetota bacterium]|jgi:protein-S-isoprenylcysteine O-methyltransferase Ste14
MRSILRFLARPPVIALAWLGLALALTLLGLGERVVPTPLRLVGLVFAAVGLWLGGAGLWTFHRRETTHQPFGRPAVLVTTGLYRFTRNPMYLGLTSGLLGIGLLVGNVPFLLVAPAFFLTANAFHVPYEEKRLEEIFGDAFRAYRRRVRRWL